MNDATISAFDEEYRYWRQSVNPDTGEHYSHFEALNKARDWYRQYGRREVLESDTMSLDQFEQEETVDSGQLLDFNRLIHRILEVEYERKLNSSYGRKEKLVRLVFLIVRLEGLDHLLDETNLRRSFDEIGDIQVGSMAEIAIAMGYKVKANGCSNSLTELKYGLQNFLRDFGFAKQEDGHVEFA